MSFIDISERYVNDVLSFNPLSGGLLLPNYVLGDRTPFYLFQPTLY